MQKTKKTSIILAIIIIFSACLGFGKLFFGASKAKKPIFVFGHATFIVISPSMEPAYPTNCLVVIRKTPFEKLKVGDAIVFKADALGGGLAFHRITQITNDGVIVKGDNNANEDNQIITKVSYVGKCVTKSTFLGKLIQFILTPKGFLACIVLPSVAFYIGYKALKIYKRRDEAKCQNE